jgi:hypothetical protein
MERYWITFEKRADPSFLNLGVGVTAYSEADAREIVHAAFDRPMAKVEVISDMREIEQNHVAPNVGNHFKRGIWFPLGYEMADRATSFKQGPKKWIAVAQQLMTDSTRTVRYPFCEKATLKLTDMPFSPELLERWISCPHCKETTALRISRKAT